MKNFLVKVGFIGASLLLLGTIFKFFHYPGSGILLVLGGVTMGIIFPINFFLSRKQDKLNQMLGFLFMLFMMCISLAFVFKVQHWPGAGILIYLSIPICLITVIYLVFAGKNEKDEQNKYKNYLFAILLLAGFTVAIFPAIMGPSGSYINSFVTLSNTYRAQTAALEINLKNSEQSFEAKKNAYTGLVNPYYEKVEKVEKLSDSLISFIKDLRATLISKTDNIDIKVADTIHLENVIRKDNIDISAKILLGETPEGNTGKANELKVKIEKYNALISNYTEKAKDTFSMSLQTADVSENGEMKIWEKSRFQGKFLVACIATLDQLIVEVLQTKYAFISSLSEEANNHIINYLQEKIRKANIKDKEDKPEKSDKKK